MFHVCQGVHHLACCCVAVHQPEKLAQLKVFVLLQQRHSADGVCVNADVMMASSLPPSSWMARQNCTSKHVCVASVDCRSPTFMPQNPTARPAHKQQAQTPWLPLPSIQHLQVLPIPFFSSSSWSSSWSLPWCCCCWWTAKQDHQSPPKLRCAAHFVGSAAANARSSVMGDMPLCERCRSTRAWSMQATTHNTWATLLKAFQLLQQQLLLPFCFFCSSCPPFKQMLLVLCRQLSNKDAAVVGSFQSQT